MAIPSPSTSLDMSALVLLSSTTHEKLGCNDPESHDSTTKSESKISEFLSHLKDPLGPFIDPNLFFRWLLRVYQAEYLQGLPEEVKWTWRQAIVHPNDGWEPSGGFLSKEFVAGMFFLLLLSPAQIDPPWWTHQD